MTGICLAITAAVQAGATQDFLAAHRQATAEAWQGFVKQHPDKALAPLARYYAAAASAESSSEAAIELLRIKPAKTDTPLAKVVDDARNGLLAQLMMQKLRAPLRQYYRKQVQYPATLDELVEAKLITAADLLDPYGERFEYQAMPRPTMPKVARQTYTLRCRRVGADLDQLSDTLKKIRQPVAGVVIESTSVQRNQAYAKWPRQDGTLSPSRAWSPDEPAEGLRLLMIAEAFVIIDDHGIPKVTPTEQAGP
jgi:hypothetical protein